MKKLYIVSTYYHALISCVKQLLNHDEADIICTSYIPDGRTLADKINESELFNKTYYVDKINEYEPLNKVDYIFFYHKKNAEAIEKQFSINMSIYDEISIYHDNTWFAHYLKDRRINYRLIEDSLDCFKNISKSNFAFMLSGSRIKSVIKNFFRIGYVYCGRDKYTAEVEVNEKKDVEITPFAGGKLVEVPRGAMFNALKAKDIDILNDIFLKDMPEIISEKTVLLLTQPFYEDNVLKSESEQISLYRQLIGESINDMTEEQLVIKPHPRDNIDYSSVFSKAVILNKNMPVEILRLKKNTDFLKIISVNSTATNFLKAKGYYTMKNLLEEKNDL